MNDDQREKLFFQDEKHEKVNICMNIFMKLLVISLVLRKTSPGSFKDILPRVLSDFLSFKDIKQHTTSRYPGKIIFYDCQRFFIDSTKINRSKFCVFGH